MEVDPRVLPTKDAKSDVTPTPSPALEAEEVKSAPEPKAEAEKRPEVQPKGSQTPETLLYAALREEREKRRALEEELKNIKDSAPSQEYGNEIAEEELRQQLGALNERVTSLQETVELERVLARHPELSAKADEFETYRKEYASLGIEKAAKLFLIEQGIAPARKGLEKASGGPRAPLSPGISKEDVEKLRKEQPRRYIQMIRDGKLNPDEIR